MPKEYYVAGKKTMLYTIGEVAKMVKRTTRTLKLWERDGYMSKAKFRHKGHRLYSEEQIQTIKSHIKKHKVASGRQRSKNEVISLFSPPNLRRSGSARILSMT